MLHRILPTILLAAQAVLAEPCEPGKDPRELAAAFEAEALAGRLHQDGAATCLTLLEASADSAAEQVLNQLRAARRHLGSGRDADAAVLARGVLNQEGLPTPIRAEAELVLAEALLVHWRIAEAEPRLHAALAVTDTANELPVLHRLRVQIALSRLYGSRRDIANCQNHAEQAIELARRHWGERGPALAWSLLELGFCQRLAGDHGASLASLQQARELQNEDEPGGNHYVAARSRLMLGQGYRIAGDYRRAETAYQEALDYLDRHPQPVPVLLTGALHGIANLYRFDGRAAQSLPRYEQAIPIYEQAYGDDSLLLAQVLNNYANALAIVGRLDEAIAQFERSLAIALRQGPDIDPANLLPIANIAMIRLWQERYDEAAEGFARSVEITARQAAGDDTGALFPQLGLAASRWGQGRHREAFAIAEQAERERQLAVDVATRRLSESAAISFQQVLYQALDVALAIAADSDDADLVARAWTLAMAARGQVTAQIAARLALARGSDEPVLRERFERWAQAGSALADLRLLAPESLAIGQLAAAQQALDRAEQALAEAASGIGHGLELGRGDLGQVQAALADGNAVLLSLITSYLAAPSDFALPAATSRPRRVLALVADAGTVRIHALGDEAQFDRATRSWLRAVGDPNQPLTAVRRAGQVLRRSLLDPLALNLDRVLFVVAHGELHRLNLAALPDPERGWLLDRGLRWHALDHELDLLRSAPARTQPDTVLAVADPDLSQLDPLCTQAAPPRALAGARREIERLRALLPEGSRQQVLTGAAASVSAVSAALPGQALIHIASHGIHARGDCAEDANRGRAAVLSVAAETAGAETGAGAGGIGALLLTPQPQAQAGQRSGLLTEAMIASLPLDQAGWVVLSACETGLGDSRYYEGAFGLRRAFRLAGAATVISSLWRIDDEATADWMAALYEARLVDGADTPTAMQHAQRTVLAARRAAGQDEHPYWWAGFIAAGAWR